MYSIKEISALVRRNRNALHIHETVDKRFCPKPRIVKLYKEILPDTYIVARHYAFSNSLDEFPHQEPTVIEIDLPDFAMHDYQASIHNGLLNILRNKPYSAFLTLATGLGKTRIAVKIISSIKVRTLVVVPTIHISNQWKDTVNALIPAFKDYVDVFVINTARVFNQERMEQYGFVVLDEVHEYTSHVNKQIMWSSMYVRHVLGLSATPDTANGLLPFLEGFIGRPLTFDVPVPSFNVKVYNIHYYGKGEYIKPVFNVNGDVSVMGTIQNILKDPERLKVILTFVKKLTKLHKTFVFAETREFLDIIKINLEKNGILSLIEEDVEILRGGVKAETLDSIQNAKAILTTYAYSRRGISYKDFTAAILATPRKRQDIIEQVIGRILRIDGDVSIKRRLVDIHDANTVLRRQNEEHVKLYHTKKYDVEEIELTA